MGRRRKPNDLQYDLPDKFNYYGSWSYTQTIPESKFTELYNLLLKTKGQAYIDDMKFSKTSTKARELFRHVFYETEEFKLLSVEFDNFIVENPWISEYYRFTFDKTSYVENPFAANRNNFWISIKDRLVSKPDEIELQKRVVNWFNEKIDFRRFVMLGCRSNDMILMFNEIKRDVPFVVGNIVVLRPGFLNTQRHDPFFREPPEIKKNDRIGLITELLTDTNPASFNGKGSRLVNVCWSATGKTSKHTISSLKLFDRKNNNMIGKLVDNVG